MWARDLMSQRATYDSLPFIFFIRVQAAFCSVSEARLHSPRAWGSHNLIKQISRDKQRSLVRANRERLVS
eukprot:gene31137-40488_t